MKTSQIPFDADGDAMRRLIDGGADTSRPMKIDFHVAVPDEDSGRKIASAAAARDYECELHQDDETMMWTCSCSRVMLLDYGRIIHAQQELDRISIPFGGYSDGWGTFGNV